MFPDAKEMFVILAAPLQTGCVGMYELRLQYGYL